MRDEKTEKSPLIEAIKKRDVVAVTRLLAAGADPNGRETLYTLPSLRERTEGGKPYQGDTPLVIAVGYRELPIVRLLLQKGADVNAQGAYGTTPLMEAMRPEELEMAKLLLEHGAKPDLVTKWGATALVEAAGYPSRGKHISLLIRAGANPNGVIGRTPLAAASDLQDPENVQVLLRNGAKVNLQRPGFGTPLYYARDSIEMATLLRKAGGKLRSPVAVKSRDTKPLPPTSPPAKVQITPRDQKLSSEDIQVLELALTDLCTYRGKDIFLPRDKGTNLIVANTTRIYNGYDDNQLNADLENAQALEITLAMREQLAQRNVTSVSIASWKPSSPALQLRDQKSLTDIFGRFGEKEATARAWVSLSLPAYEALREKAVLRFSFGPTPHGASGTYFLTKRQGKWEIAWRRFSYYA